MRSRLRSCSFGEQPDVLDGDHRLVGERLQQRDLLFRKRLGFEPSDGNGPYWVAIAHHWHCQRAPVLNAESHRLVVVGVFEHVRHVHHGPIEDRPAAGGCPARAHRKQLQHRLAPLRADVLVGD